MRYYNIDFLQIDWSAKKWLWLVNSKHIGYCLTRILRFFEWDGTNGQNCLSLTIPSAACWTQSHSSWNYHQCSHTTWLFGYLSRFHSPTWIDFPVLIEKGTEIASLPNNLMHIPLYLKSIKVEHGLNSIDIFGNHPDNICIMVVLLSKSSDSTMLCLSFCQAVCTTSA